RGGPSSSRRSRTETSSFPASTVSGVSASRRRWLGARREWPALGLGRCRLHASSRGGRTGRPVVAPSSGRLLRVPPRTAPPPPSGSRGIPAVRAGGAVRHQQRWRAGGRGAALALGRQTLPRARRGRESARRLSSRPEHELAWCPPAPAPDAAEPRAARRLQGSCGKRRPLWRRIGGGGFDLRTGAAPLPAAPSDHHLGGRERRLPVVGARGAALAARSGADVGGLHVPSRGAVRLEAQGACARRGGSEDPPTPAPARAGA